MYALHFIFFDNLERGKKRKTIHWKQKKNSFVKRKATNLTKLNFSFYYKLMSLLLYDTCWTRSNLILVKANKWSIINAAFWFGWTTTRLYVIAH